MKKFIINFIKKIIRNGKSFSRKIFEQHGQNYLGKYILKNKLLDEPIVIIDIGARGGLQNKWGYLTELISWIGFEPDSEECNRINTSYQRSKFNFSIYPYAISDSKGKKIFYVTKFPYSSGFIPGDKNFLKRLYSVASENLKIVKQVELETITLSDFIKENDIASVDFLKIDTEGYEHKVLMGAKDLFEKSNVLGVEVELWFGPLKDPDSFSFIDKLLRKHGFFLYDISVRRYPRISFPRGYLVRKAFNIYKTLDSKLFGQVLTGDAVYLRDPVWEMQNCTNKFVWNDEIVLKMTLIYEVFCLYDCAIELLTEYQNNFNSNLPFKDLIDSLTPKISHYKQLKYNDYLKQANKLPWREMNMYKKHWVNYN